MIVGGALTPGSRLPVEQVLADTLGVSRGSLREAVRALAMMGILDSRQGDGTYVTSLALPLLLAPFSFLVDVQGEEGAADPHAVRRILETEAAGLAAARMGDDAIAEAKGILVETEHLLDAVDGAADHDAIFETDTRFHQRISASVGNRALDALIEATSSRTVRARLRRAKTELGAEHRTLSEHRGILRAIERREPEVARALMAAHLLAVEQAVQVLPG